MTEVALAAYLGTSTSTVGYARRKLRDGKWMCAVRFEPCLRCGEIVTIRGSHNTQFYHTVCARAVQSDRLKRWNAARSKTTQKRLRLHTSALEIQKQTRASALTSMRKTS